MGAHAIYNPSEGAYERAIYCFALSVDWAALTLPSEYMDHGEDEALNQPYQIVFPPSHLYNGKDGWSEVDIKVVLANGQVYAATAFSLKYIKVHFHRYGEGYFWKKDMLIVSDIRRRTLKKQLRRLSKRIVST